METVLLMWPQTPFPGNLFPGWSSQRRFQAQNAWNLFERVETYDSNIRISIGNQNGTYSFPSRSTDTKRVPPPAVNPLWYPLTASDRVIYREGQRLHLQACPKINWTSQRSLPLPTAPLKSVFPEYLWPGAPIIQSALATMDGSGADVYFLQPAGIITPDGNITNYKYTIDGGKTYTTFSPAQTASPLRISPLANNVPVYIQLVAIGFSTCGLVQLSGISNGINVIPGAPLLQNITATADANEAHISFVRSSDIVTNHKYTIDGGKTYTTFSPAQTASPLRISPLVNDALATIQLVAISPLGLSEISNPVQNPLPPTLYYDALYNTGTNISNRGTYGTMAGTAVNVTYQEGPKAYKVFDFSGNSSYITFGKYNFGSVITLLMWVKPSSTTNTNTLTNRGSGITSASFNMGWKTCSPRFITMPSTLKWSEAAGYAAARGFRLATAAQVREYLSTTYGGGGAFDGDIWAPVSDGSNNWIAIGRAYPSRIGQLHHDLGFGLPSWGEDASSLPWRAWMPIACRNKRDSYLTIGNDSAVAVDAITCDIWQHVGYIVDQVNHRVTLFVNGVTVNSTEITTMNNISLNNSSITIGAFVDLNYYMNSQIGYIKVYNYVFNATAMNNEYMKSKARFGL